jgi:hypothetical protein
VYLHSSLYTLHTSLHPYMVLDKDPVCSQGSTFREDSSVTVKHLTDLSSLGPIASIQRLIPK